MKIAITIKEKTENSVVDSRFGRCAYFLIYDDETKEKSFIDNTQNLNAAQGAGVQSAQNVLKGNAEILITANLGPNAHRILSQSNIKLYSAPQDLKVDEVLTLLKDGKLKELDNPNVEGHWQ